MQFVAFQVHKKGPLDLEQTASLMFSVERIIWKGNTVGIMTRIEASESRESRRSGRHSIKRIGAPLRHTTALISIMY